MSEHQRDRPASHLMLAFLSGAAAGAGVALLTAPRSGRETREALRSSYEGSRRRVERLPVALRSARDAARDELGHALDQHAERDA